MGNLFAISMSVDDEELKRKLDSFDGDFNRAVSTVFDYNAAYGTAWMKANARWHDNTGAARASLTAVANNHGSSHEMLLAHGVHYGIWLEVAHNRKYEILSSAMRHVGSKIMGDLKQAFGEAAK